MVSIVCNLFTFYIVYFMLYITMMITQKQTSCELKDTILGRKIPKIVYINNLTLFKNAVEKDRDKLAHDALKRQELRARAQMNEFMFAMLRKNHIAYRLNENIGTLFFNMRRTSGIQSDKDDYSLLNSLISSPFNDSDANTDELSVNKQYYSYATNESCNSS